MRKEEEEERIMKRRRKEGKTDWKRGWWKCRGKYKERQGRRGGRREE